MSLRDQFNEIGRRTARFYEGTYAGGNGSTHSVFLRDLGRNVQCTARGDVYLPGEPVAVGLTDSGEYFILNLSQRGVLTTRRFEDANTPNARLKPRYITFPLGGERSLRPIVFPSRPTLQAVRYMYQQVQTNSINSNVSNPFQVPLFDLDPNFRDQWGFSRDSGAYWIENIIEVESNLESPETWSRSQIIPGAGLVPTELTIFREASRVTLAVLPTVGAAGGAANLIPPPNLLNYNITILRRTIGVLGETMLRSLKTNIFSTHAGNFFYQGATKRKHFELTNAGGTNYIVDGVTVTPVNIPEEPNPLGNNLFLDSTRGAITYKGLIGYSPSFNVRYELPGYDTAGDNRDKTNASIFRLGNIAIQAQEQTEGITDEAVFLHPYDVTYTPARQAVEDDRNEETLIAYFEDLFPDFAGRFDIAPNYPFQGLIDDFPVELFVRAGGLNLVRLDTLPIRASSAYEFLWFLGGHLSDLDFTGTFFRTPELTDPLPLVKVLGVQPWMQTAFIRVFVPSEEGGEWIDAFEVNRTSPEDPNLSWVNVSPGNFISGTRFELFIQDVFLEQQRFGFPPRIELLTRETNQDILQTCGFDRIAFTKPTDSSPGFIPSPFSANEGNYVNLQDANWNAIGHDILVGYTGNDFQDEFSLAIDDANTINNFDYFFHPDPLYDVNSVYFPFENQNNDLRIRAVWF